MTKYYYDNHDLKLLLDLLDVVHGTATCLQVLSILDSEFNEEWVIPDIVISVASNLRSTVSGDMKTDKENQIQNYNLRIRFQDAPSRAGILNDMNVINFGYMVSLYPPTKSTSSIKISIKSESHSSVNNQNMDLQNKTSAQEHSCALVDLDVSREYAIRIDTILNGKILGNRTEFFGPIKCKVD